jgi:hypothetical protein
MRSRSGFALLLMLVAACSPTSPPAPPAPPPPTTGMGGADPGAGGSPGSSAGSGGAPAGAGGSGGGAQAGAGGSAGGGGAAPAPADGGSSPVAGPPDAGAAADGPSAAPSACAGKFCDDFESFAAGGAPAGSWKAALDRGTLAIDETKAWSGSRAVRFTHQGAPAKMFIELRQPVLPMPGNLVYGRLMYYLTKSPSGQYSHFEIVRGGGPLAGGGRAQLNTGAENGKVVLNYEPGDCTKYSQVPFPEKRWTCYQWRFDGAKNDIHEWVDGVSADDVPVAPAGQCWRAPMAVDTLHVGWQSYHGTQPVELWIDDVAVGDQPIPCPAGAPSKP